MLHEAAFRLHGRCSGSKHVMFGLGSQPQGVLGIYKYPKVHKYLKWFRPPACQRKDAHPVIGCQLQALPAPVLCVFTQDQGRGLRWRTRMEDQGEGQEAECQRRTLQVACTMRTGRGSSTGSCRVAWTSGILGQVGRVHLKRNKQEALDSGLKMQKCACLSGAREEAGLSWMGLECYLQNPDGPRVGRGAEGSTTAQDQCSQRDPAHLRVQPEARPWEGQAGPAAACGRLAREKAAGLPWFRTPSRVELGKDLELVPGALSSCLLRVCWE